MSAVVFPALPTEYVNSDDPTVAIFAPGINSEYDILVKLTNDFETVREAHAKAETVLSESDDAVAVEYRKEEDDANEAIEAAQAKYDALVKDAKDALAKSRNAIRDELKKAQTEALTKLGAEIVGDIDQDKLAADYTIHVNAFTKLVKLIKDEVPAMVEFAKAVPTPVKQAKGNSTASGGVRGTTPRFVSITVDGVAVEPTTLGAAAKAAGIKGAGGRKVLFDRLLGVVITTDNISTDVEKPNVFEVTVNEVVHTVAVVGKVPSAEDSE